MKKYIVSVSQNLLHNSIAEHISKLAAKFNTDGESLPLSFIHGYIRCELALFPASNELIKTINIDARKLTILGENETVLLTLEQVTLPNE